MSGSARFVPITESVWAFPDTCMVYVLRRGEEAVLVDFGSGHVLDHLEDIGVRRVAAVLHTHHHRDQAQGDEEAVRRGIPIVVPLHERHLFDQVETFWSTKQLYDLYDVRNTTFTLTRSVPVSDVLEDRGVWRWKDLHFEVLPTPAHTPGSVSLLCRIDGALVAFVGDLLCAPGKVVTLFDLQYAYGAVDGVESAILSLNLLGERAPDLLCPSHGEPMRDGTAAIARTRDNLRSFFRLQSGGALAVDEVDFTPVASRLLHATQACSSFYAILSRDGKRALFVDYGAPSFGLFQPVGVRFEPGERARFIHHSLDRLVRQYGVRGVEAVIPSHYHDDHINGIPYLQSAMGTEVWAYENMKEILEKPTGELIGCVLPDPIPVARTFRDGERFEWEGIRFDVHFSPGHCDYHMSMFTEMDGKRIAFSGDNVWPPGFVPSLIYRNHVHRTSHLATARLYREYRPQVLCSGHGLHTNVAPEGYDVFFSNAERLTRLFDELLPERSGILGLEPSWIQIYPYQMAADPGDTLSGELRIKSPVERDEEVRFRWVLPEGWKAEPAEGAVTVERGASATSPFSITIPASYRFSHPRQAVALEVSLGNRELGQVAEAVVENRPYGPASVRPRLPSPGGAPPLPRPPGSVA